MPETCPKCSRRTYRGTVREVLADECALEDGIGCRAYRHGVEVGRLLTQGANGTEARAFLQGFEVGTVEGHEEASRVDG